MVVGALAGGPDVTAAAARLDVTAAGWAVTDATGTAAAGVGDTTAITGALLRGAGVAARTTGAVSTTAGGIDRASGSAVLLCGGVAVVTAAAGARVDLAALTTGAVDSAPEGVRLPCWPPRAGELDPVSGLPAESAVATPNAWGPSQAIPVIAAAAAIRALVCSPDMATTPLGPLIKSLRLEIYGDWHLIRGTSTVPAQ